MPFDSEAPVIDKGVPMPRSRSVNARIEEMARQMEVGDSVLAERVGIRANSIVAWGRTNGMKFAERKTKEGVRVWRVA